MTIIIFEIGRNGGGQWRLASEWLASEWLASEWLAGEWLAGSSSWPWT